MTNTSVELKIVCDCRSVSSNSSPIFFTCQFLSSSTIGDYAVARRLRTTRMGSRANGRARDQLLDRSALCRLTWGGNEFSFLLILGNTIVEFEFFHLIFSYLNSRDVFLFYSNCNIK